MGEMLRHRFRRNLTGLTPSTYIITAPLQRTASSYYSQKLVLEVRWFNMMGRQDPRKAEMMKTQPVKSFESDSCRFESFLAGDEKLQFYVSPGQSLGHPLHLARCLNFLHNFGNFPRKLKFTRLHRWISTRSICLPRASPRVSWSPSFLLK